LTVSVVVVAYDAVTDLPQCLRSLVASGLALAEKVVVVDTSADGRHRDFVAMSDCTWLPLPSNPGYGAALNAGIARTSGDALVLANADVDFDAGCARSLTDRALETGGIVFPVQLDSVTREPHVDSLLEDLSVADSVHRWLGVGRAASERARAKELQRALESARITPIPNGRSGSGACLAVARSCVEGLGGVPEYFFLQEEDRLLSQLARESGRPVELHGGCVVVHAGGFRNSWPTAKALLARASTERSAFRARGHGVPPIVYGVQILGIAARLAAAPFVGLRQ
jgi:GT2 family glycosyltransferase